MIGNLTIDKASMNLSYFLNTVRIIHLNGGRISRSDFVQQMADFIGVPARKDGKENRTPYNKSKLPRYFGFVDIDSDGSGANYLVLTHRGKKLVDFISENTEADASQMYFINPEYREAFIDLVFESVIFDSFGKNNCGAEQSNTDVEPPKIVFKTIHELGRATAEEICYVMFGLNRGEFATFDEAIAKIRSNRDHFQYDYSTIMSDWKLTNIVNDCKIINIFTDDSIKLLRSERDEEIDKVFYYLSSNLSQRHLDQIQTINAVYQPLRLFVYTDGNDVTIRDWVEDAVLGRVSDNSFVFQYHPGDTLCGGDDGNGFIPGLFEEALLKAFKNPKKNVFLILNHIKEEQLPELLGKYYPLLKQVDDLASSNHGWSDGEIVDEAVFTYLDSNLSASEKILPNNKVKIPSNIQLVGTVIMDNTTENTNFNYKFTRAFVETSGATPDFTVLSPEWFHDKAQEFAAEDSEAAAMYIDFNSRFGIDALSALSGEDLLKTLFLGASSDNLCHELEYVARNTELFGSVKGGNAFKYPMFFDKEASMWTSGTRANPKQLSLDEAIIKGTAVRDGLVKGAEIIKNSLPVDSVEDYLTLYTELYAAIPDLVDSLWVIKYYHMLFPELIPVFYNKDWQIRVLTALKITPNDTAYGRLGQIDAFVEECDVTNVAFARVFHKYCRNISVDEHEDIGLDEVVAQRVKGGTNIILYGVPGAGKSWTIKHEYCDDKSRMERLVFHPDYTYSDFVGQILPKVGDDGSVSYEFSAGPFTKLVRKAYINPDKMYYLVIEEVNRGNAPAIFGDVFQLLDRDKYGASEYEITNADIAKIVYLNDSHKVSIPSNMCILCTMNTSDQNVFTLDTAFQRRWNMRLIKNKFHDEEDELRFAGTMILDTDVTWEKFFTEINSFILGKNIRMTSSEDKRLGTHFVSEDDLRYEEGNERQNSRFAEKVLKYLWDDAFKFTKEDVFDLEKVKSLEDVIELFVSSTGNARFLVFKENIYNSLVPKSNA